MLFYKFGKIKTKKELNQRFIVSRKRKNQIQAAHQISRDLYHNTEDHALKFQFLVCDLLALKILEKFTSFLIFKIPVILYINVTVREQVFIELNTVIICHRRDIINDYLIWFCFNIRCRSSVMVS